MAGIEQEVVDNTLVNMMSDLGSRIRVSLDFMCSDSISLPEVLVHLLSKNVISQPELEIVESKDSNYNRFRQLFTFLIPRVDHGDNSQHFVYAFQQSNNQHILDKLRSAIVTTDFDPRFAGTVQSIRFNVREPVPSFFGRENFLHVLDKHILQSHRTAADVPATSTIISRICVVTGLGGIGKTETIRKYIHSYSHRYKHVVWIDAEEKRTAKNQFRKLAIELQLTSKDIENKAKDFDALVKDVYDRLCTSSTLLVLDNAETLYDSNPKRPGVSRFLPKCLPPTLIKPVVIITSRIQDWHKIHATPLPLLTTKESSEFLIQQLKLEENDVNAKDAMTLSETFDGLPLALQAAASVIRRESRKNKLMGKDVYTVQDLLRDYNQGKREVLQKRPPSCPDATPLMFLWKVSLDKIRQQSHGHLATDILDVIAHLSPTNIPKDLLFFIFNSNKEQSLVDAVALLVDYSFVHNSRSHFSIHRMLQDVTLAHLEASTEKHSQNWFMNLRIWTFLKLRRRSNETPPLTRITTALMQYWPTLPKSSEAYDAVHDNLVHVTMSHVLPKAQNPAEADLHLLKFIEFVLMTIKDTRWVEAEKCCRVLINYFISSVFPSHSASHFTSHGFRNVRDLQRQLAEILDTMGRYKEAEDICQESLASLDSLEDHEDVMKEILDTKHRLASILDSQGEYDKAIKLGTSVTDQRSKLHGPTHESTLSTKNNLALALQNSGRLSEAKTLYAEILEVRMKEQGPLHLDTLATKHNMALILEEERRYDDSLEMLREMTVVWEKELGPLHTSTLDSNTNMAGLQDEQRKDEDALQIYESVISSYEKTSAASQPDCLEVKTNMALSLGQQVMVDEETKMHCHVLDPKERLLGPNHKDTLITRQNLATILETEGRNDDALAMQRELAEVQEMKHGPLHASTHRSNCSMAYVLAKQGKCAEAIKLYEEVLELETKQLGSTHHHTLRTNNSIGWLHLKMGDFEKAGRIARDVLAATQATLPIDHPDSKDTKHSVASILERQGDYEKAIELLSSVIVLRSKLHRKSTLTTKHENSLILAEEGRYDQALEMLRMAVEVRERELGPLHASTNMAGLQDEQGKDEDALQIYESVISSYEKASAASQPDCLEVKTNTALSLGQQVMVDEETKMHCRVLDARARLLGPSHISTLASKNIVTWVLAEQGNHADPLKRFEEVLKRRTKQLGAMHPITLVTNNNIGWWHLKMGNFEKAESIAKEVLAAVQATLPSDHPIIKGAEELYENARLRNNP